MRGVIAVGDSITNGHGAPIRGVPSQGWSQWLADAMGVWLLKVSRGGATSAEVATNQLPLLEGVEARLATLTIGTNDTMRHWDPARFEESLDVCLAALATSADEVAVLTVVERHRGPNAARANEIIRARSRSAIIVDVSDLAGFRLMTGDTVHPTALGQLEIADRAQRALSGRIDMPVPSTLRPLGRPEVGYLGRHAVARTEREARRLARTLLRR